MLASPVIRVTIGKARAGRPTDAHRTSHTGDALMASGPAEGPRIEPGQDGPDVRLAFGSLFWRAAVITFVVLQLQLVSRIRRRLRWANRVQRVAFFLYKTPKSLYVAFFVGAVVAVVADLVVRLLL